MYRRNYNDLMEKDDYWLYVNELNKEKNPYLNSPACSAFDFYVALDCTTSPQTLRNSTFSYMLQPFD